MTIMVENNEPELINYKFYLNSFETMCMYMKLTNSDTLLTQLLVLYTKQYFQKFSILQR